MVTVHCIINHAFNLVLHGMLVKDRPMILPENSRYSQEQQYNVDQSFGYRYRDLSEEMDFFLRITLSWILTETKRRLTRRIILTSVDQPTVIHKTFYGCYCFHFHTISDQVMIVSTATCREPEGHCHLNTGIRLQRNTSGVSVALINIPSNKSKRCNLITEKYLLIYFENKVNFLG